MKMSKVIAFVLLILVCSSPLFAKDDTLLLADVPIKYGEEHFIQRINERTKGEREPLGLVLTGGSARAMAHIGVLKYLEEQEIVPDFIICNSMGFIISALYSAGMSPDQIMKICSDLDIPNLFDVSIPINTGILNTEKFISLLCSYIPKVKDLKDLEIPVMVICEDLVTKRQIRIMEGDLATVLKGSFAITVYFPSIEYNGHLLIDGGCANIAPLDVAYDYAPFNIVATTFYNAELNLLNPITALNVSIDIPKRRYGVASILRNQDRSIWIRCDVEGFSFMDFAAADELTERGYESAKQAFANIDFNYDCGKLSPSMIEARKEVENNIQTINKAYSYFHHTSAKNFTSYFGVGAKSFSFDFDPYYFRDDIVMGISYNMKVGQLDFRTIAGVSWQSFNFGKVVPSIYLDTKFYPTPPIELSIDLSYMGNMLPTASVLYLRQGAKYLLPEFNKNQFAINQSFELSYDFNSGAIINTYTKGFSQWLLASFSYQRTTKALKLKAEAGFNYLYKDLSKGLYAFASTNNSLSLFNLFELHAGLTFRTALDSKSKMIMFVNDGYRTQNIDVLFNQNKGKSALITSFALDWHFVPKLTYGEMFIIDDTYLSVYCDLLFNKEQYKDPFYSVGLKIHSNLSFIGLKNIKVSFYVGYESSNNKMLAGIIFGD